MAHILLIGTHGSEDPTRAALAFLFAKGAVEEGHRPEVILAGDAAVLARQTVGENVIPVGLPPQKRHVCLLNPAAVAEAGRYEVVEGRTPEIWSLKWSLNHATNEC